MRCYLYFMFNNYVKQQNLLFNIMKFFLNGFSKKVKLLETSFLAEKLAKNQTTNIKYFVY